MAEMSWEYADQVRAALRAIVSDPDYGSAALSSPRIVSNLLKDYLPDAPREKGILVAAAEAGLAGTLRDHVSTGMDPATAIRLTASSFAANTVFQVDACEWVTRELAVALELIRGDSAVSLDATPAGPVASPPAQVSPAPAQVSPAPAQVSPAPAQVAPAPTQVSPPPAQVATAPTQVSPPPAQVSPPPAQDSPAPAQGVPQPFARSFPQVSEGATFLPDPAAAYPWRPTGGTAVAAAQPGVHGRRKARIAMLAGLVAAAIVVALIVIRLTGILNSAPPAEPLNDVIAPFASLCGPSAQSFSLSGTTSSYLCRQTSGTGINVLAYQFDNAADYQAGFASLNSRTGFVAVGASGSCPPPAGSRTGSTGWHSTRSATYPARSGQVLECYTDGHNHFPLLVWTLPTQRVVLLADDGATGASLSLLYNWWTTLSFS